MRRLTFAFYFWRKDDPCAILIEPRHFSSIDEATAWARNEMRVRPYVKCEMYQVTWEREAILTPEDAHA